MAFFTLAGTALAVDLLAATAPAALAIHFARLASLAAGCSLGARAAPWPRHQRRSAATCHRLFFGPRATAWPLPSQGGAPCRRTSGACAGWPWSRRLASRSASHAPWRALPLASVPCSAPPLRGARAPPAPRLPQNLGPQPAGCTLSWLGRRLLCAGGGHHCAEPGCGAAPLPVCHRRSRRAPSGRGSACIQSSAAAELTWRCAVQGRLTKRTAGEATRCCRWATDCASRRRRWSRTQGTGEGAAARLSIS